MTRNTDLTLIHPRLAVDVARIVEYWTIQHVANAPAYEIHDRKRLSLALFEGHRTSEAQADAYKRGTSKCDGVTTWSRHQYEPSCAVDLVVKIDGKWTWGDGLNAQDKALVMSAYRAIGPVVEALGYEWGGRFQTFVDGELRPWPDMPHVQLGKAEMVSEVQRLLTVLGYAPGPVDGIYGAKTEAAVTAWAHSACARGLIGNVMHVPGRIEPWLWVALWSEARENGVE